MSLLSYTAVVNSTAVKYTYMLSLYVCCNTAVCFSCLHIHITACGSYERVPQKHALCAVVTKLEILV